MIFRDPAFYHSGDIAWLTTDCDNKDMEINEVEAEDGVVINYR